MAATVHLVEQERLRSARAPIAGLLHRADRAFPPPRRDSCSGRGKRRRAPCTTRPFTVALLRIDALRGRGICRSRRAFLAPIQRAASAEVPPVEKRSMTAAGWGSRLVVAALALSACKPAGKQPPAVTMTTPATHAFGIASGPHAVNCDSCHGAFASFKEFTCTGCHGHEKPVTDMLHASVPARGPTTPSTSIAYSWDSASCLQCHSTGARMLYDHAG